MATQELKKPRYYAPTVSVDVDVSLDEFSMDDIHEYLRHKGEQVTVHTGAGLFIAQDELDRILTLAVCGQLEAARNASLEIISEAIERKL